MLALGDESLVDRPFRDRRGVLEQIADGFAPPVHLAPATHDRTQAMEWFDRFEGAGLDGLIVKPLDDPYVFDKRVQLKLKHVRSADCVVAGYRIHKSGDGVGSLILGLHAPDGQLWHVGVAASFTAKRRVELLDEVAPYELDDIAEHPWSSWTDAEANADGSMPGAPNRWSGATARPLVDPAAPGAGGRGLLHVGDLGRFRGTTRMLRWRPDRDPASCSTEQLAEPAPVPITEVLAARPVDS